VHDLGGSEFFRIEHGHQKVADESQGNESDDERFHVIVVLEQAAKTGVKFAESEEGDDKDDV